MFESNNNIIESLTPAFVAKVNAAKRALGMHHNRTQDPHDSKFGYKKQAGEIYRISVFLNKGEVMSHKGVGGRGQSNRTPKEFFNPNAEDFTNELADKIAENSGDVLCGRLCIA